LLVKVLNLVNSKTRLLRYNRFQLLVKFFTTQMKPKVGFVLRPNVYRPVFQYPLGCASGGEQPLCPFFITNGTNITTKGWVGECFMLPEKP